MMSNVTYVGDPRYSFQGDTPAEAIRVVWYKVGSEYSLCLHLRYPDGREDFAPLQEALDQGYLPKPKE